MTTNASATRAAAKKKVLAQIAVTQKHAAAAKKTAKAAKSAARLAKKKLKDAKRHAKKLRKVVKTLRGELAALTARRTRTKPVASKVVPNPAPAAIAAVVATAESPPEANLPVNPALPT